MKICTKCHSQKAETEFYPRRADCKTCRKAVCKARHDADPIRAAKRCREYYQRNRIKLLERAKAYGQKNKAIKAKRRKARYERNRESILAEARKYNQAHRGERAEYQRRHRAANRERLISISKTYHETHKVRLNAASRLYYQRHKQEIHEAARQRKKRDLNFRLKCNLSGRIRTALRASKTSKSSATQSLIGCTVEFLRAHLESRFRKGMSWENYGEWHVDHKVPCAAFNLTDPEEQKRCFHFTNLQPLWAEENYRKNAKLAA